MFFSTESSVSGVLLNHRNHENSITLVTKAAKLAISTTRKLIHRAINVNMLTNVTTRTWVPQSHDKSQNNYGNKFNHGNCTNNGDFGSPSNHDRVSKQMHYKRAWIFTSYDFSDFDEKKCSKSRHIINKNSRYQISWKYVLWKSNFSIWTDVPKDKQIAWSS
jgi:hypothetical protein